MEILTISKSPFIEEVFSETAIEGGWLRVGHQRGIVEIAKKHNQELVGHGDFNFVIPFDDCRVAAIPYRPQFLPVDKAFLMYHQHNIAHILFPHNFPRFHVVIGYNPKEHNVPGSIRTWILEGCNLDFAKTDEISSTSQLNLLRLLDKVFQRLNFRFKSRVIHNPTQDHLAESESEHMKTQILYPFNNVAMVRQRFHIPFIFDEDPYSDHNFIFGEDGGVYYVDEIESLSQWKLTNKQLNDLFNTLGISKTMRDRVLDSIHAIDTFYKDWKPT